MSPELETLDQLQGGDMPLSVIRRVYPDESRFIRGVLGLLIGGDVRLNRGREPVGRWEWKAVLSQTGFADLTLSLTEQGAARIAQPKIQS